MNFIRKNRMFKNNYFKKHFSFIIILFLILFIFSMGLNFYFNFKNANYIDEIKIIIKSTGIINSNINPIIKFITKNNIFDVEMNSRSDGWELNFKRYVNDIILYIPKNQIDKINISIINGKKEIIFNKNEIINIREKLDIPEFSSANKEYISCIVTKSIKNNSSHIPVFDKVINWKGDFYFIILTLMVPIIILFIMTLFFLFMKYSINSQLINNLYTFIITFKIMLKKSFHSFYVKHSIPENISKNNYIKYDNPVFNYFLFLFVIFLMYLPVISGYYLHTDDYYWSKWGEYNNTLEYYSVIGRPISGFLFSFLFNIVQNVGLMNILRFLVLIIISFIAFFIDKWFRYWKIDRFLSFLLTIICISMPSFQVYASYFSTLQYSVSILLSLIAFNLFFKTLNKSDSFTKRFFRMLIPVFIFLIALSANQLGATFSAALIILPVLLDNLILKKDDFRELITLNFILIFLMIIFISIVAYYFFWIIGLKIFNASLGGKYDGRDIVGNIFLRIIWVLKNPIYDAMNLWNIKQNLIVPIVILIINIISTFIELINNFKQKKYMSSILYIIFKYFIVFLLVMISFSAIILSSRPTSEHRLLSPLTTSIIIMTFISFFRIIRTVTLKFHKLIITVFLIFICSLGIYFANSTMLKFIISSDTMEFRYIKNIINSYIKKNGNINEIHIITANNSLFTEFENHEFGEPNLRHGPNVAPLIRCALSELNINYHNLKILILADINSKKGVLWSKSNGRIDYFQSHYDSVEISDNALTIDMSEVSFK
jgi:hypothetical protein